MGNYIKRYITPDEFAFKRSNSVPYEGFVIGLGYATIKCECVKEKDIDSAIDSYYHFYCTVWVQELNDAEEVVRLSFPLNTETFPTNTISADVKTGIFFLLKMNIALDIGKVKHGVDNISSDVVRFATRNKILVERSFPHAGEGSGEGDEVNAFRHTLWQARITNKHGRDIAKRVGDAHEHDANVNLSAKWFKDIRVADQVIDLLNNKIGRSIGDTTRMGMRRMALRTLEVFYKDGLYTASQMTDKSWYIDRTKITQKQYDDLKAFYEKANELGRSIEEQSNVDTKRKNELEEKQRIWNTMK